MVLICISLVVSDVSHLHIPVGHWYAFFGKMSIQVLCQILNQVIHFLQPSSLNSLYILDINPLLDM